MTSSSEYLRVAASSEPARVAGAIAGTLRQEHEAVIEACGAGAVNQMVKACAIARGYIASQGLDLMVEPSFVTLAEGLEGMTGIRFIVHRVTR